MSWSCINICLFAIAFNVPTSNGGILKLSIFIWFCDTYTPAEFIGMYSKYMERIGSDTANNVGKYLHTSSQRRQKFLHKEGKSFWKVIFQFEVIFLHQHNIICTSKGTDGFELLFALHIRLKFLLLFSSLVPI